jgi:hypothetical protein
VAQNPPGRSSAIDGRTTRHPGYAAGQRLRKGVAEIFGWIKTVANLRKSRHRSPERVGWMFTLTAAAYNLVRIRNLTATASPLTEPDPRNTVITGTRRSKQPKFISESVHRNDAEVILT